MQESQPRPRINVGLVDTGSDRNNETSENGFDVAVEEALSPFINIDRASLPSGYDKPNLLQQDSQQMDEAEELLTKMDNLNILEEDKTTGDSPFSSPRGVQEEKEIQELEGAVILQQEVKNIR